MIFEDRVDAGRRLAEKLARYRGSNAIVLAIPRGGVVVGFEVAAALECPLDIVVPRKIGSPSQPELAIGAVTSDAVMLDDKLIQYLGVSKEYIDDEIRRQREEIERRERMYRENRQSPTLEGKTAILVDDGIATGYTMMAAVKDTRKRNPASLVVAVPVASVEAVEILRPHADELIVLETPESFYAVGAWYDRFEQTIDEEVINLLETAAKGIPSGRPGL